MRRLRLAASRTARRCGVRSTPRSSRARPRSATARSGRARLFGGAAGARGGRPGARPTRRRGPSSERLADEKEVLGFYVTGHPLAGGRRGARALHGRRRRARPRAGRRARCAWAGSSPRFARRARAAAQTMAFATLEDLEGSFELVIFAEHVRAAPRAGAEDALAAGRQARRCRWSCRGDARGRRPAEHPRARCSRSPRPRSSSRGARADPRARGGGDARSPARAAPLLEPTRGDCGVVLHLVIPGESETVLALAARGVDATPALLRDDRRAVRAVRGGAAPVRASEAELRPVQAARSACCAVALLLAAGAAAEVRALVGRPGHGPDAPGDAGASLRQPRSRPRSPRPRCSASRAGLGADGASGSRPPARPARGDRREVRASYARSYRVLEDSGRAGRAPTRRARLARSTSSWPRCRSTSTACATACAEPGRLARPATRPRRRRASGSSASTAAELGRPGRRSGGVSRRARGHGGPLELEPGARSSRSPAAATALALERRGGEPPAAALGRASRPRGRRRACARARAPRGATRASRGRGGGRGPDGGRRRPRSEPRARGAVAPPPD